MSYTLHIDEPVVQSLHRIAYTLIDEVLVVLDQELQDPHQTVHKVRKVGKRMRALLRLVRPALGATFAVENARFRDASRPLSPIRDATVLIDTYDALMQTIPPGTDRRGFAPVRRALTLRRAARYDADAMVAGPLAQFREAMEAARARVPGWTLHTDGFPAVKGGFKKTYQRARHTRKAAYAAQTSEAFHEWRKRVKYHWYHTELLAGIWPPVLAVRAQELDQLADILGLEHDLAVLHEVLLAEPERFGGIRQLPAFIAHLEARQHALREATQGLGLRLFAEKPKAIVRRHKVYWKTCQLD